MNSPLFKLILVHEEKLKANMHNVKDSKHIMT